MSDTYYEVEEQSKYYIIINKIDSLEEAMDVVYTSEELKELYGIDERYYYGTGHRFFKKKIAGVLNGYKRKIPEGKKSIKIDDDELIEALKVAYDKGYSLSDYIKGCRRVGNRLYIHTKKAKAKATKRDAKNFLNSFVWYLRSVSGLLLDLTGDMNDNVSETSINWVRNQATWDEYVEWVRADHPRRQWYMPSDDDLVWYKQVYDNPTMFNE